MVWRFFKKQLSVRSVAPAAIPATPKTEQSRDNLMVVVREMPGANRPDDRFTPTGPLTLEVDGKEIEFQLAWWDFIGDTHIRFVFDSDDNVMPDGRLGMSNATLDELDALGIKTVEEALAIALANIRRVYGEPQITAPYESGLMQVDCRQADFNSSFFLDRAFWRMQLERYPEGLVVCVAKRGGLIFAPLSNEEAVTLLKDKVAYLHASSEDMRVSSALFLFKDAKWSVFQAPVESDTIH